MDRQRVEYSAPRREAELRRLQQLYAVAQQAYQGTQDEWEQAVAQARAWHRYEQQLVHQRNAMNSALLNLNQAIKALEELSGERTDTE